MRTLICEIFTKMIYLLSHRLDSFQTCTDIPFGQPLEMNMLGDLDPIVKVESQLTNGNFYLKVRYFMNRLVDFHQTFMVRS